MSIVQLISVLVITFILLISTIEISNKLANDPKNKNHKKQISFIATLVASLLLSVAFVCEIVWTLFNVFR